MFTELHLLIPDTLRLMNVLGINVSTMVVCYRSGDEARLPKESKIRYRIPVSDIDRLKQYAQLLYADNPTLGYLAFRGYIRDGGFTAFLVQMHSLHSRHLFLGGETHSQKTMASHGNRLLKLTLDYLGPEDYELQIYNGSSDDLLVRFELGVGTE